MVWELFSRFRSLTTSRKTVSASVLCSSSIPLQRAATIFTSCSYPSEARIWPVTFPSSGPSSKNPERECVGVWVVDNLCNHLW